MGFRKPPNQPLCGLLAISGIILPAGREKPTGRGTRGLDGVLFRRLAQVYDYPLSGTIDIPLVPAAGGAEFIPAVGMVIDFAAVLADSERVRVCGQEDAVSDLRHGFQAIEAPEHFGRILCPHLEGNARVGIGRRHTGGFRIPVCRVLTIFLAYASLKMCVKPFGKCCAP